MHAPLVIGTFVCIIVLIAGMITAFAVQTGEHMAEPQHQLDASKLTRKGCSMPLERLENPI